MFPRESFSRRFDDYMFKGYKGYLKAKGEAE
jgi:hypothetical protein